MRIGLFFSVFIIELFLNASLFFQKECFKCQFEFRLKPGLLRIFSVCFFLLEISVLTSIAKMHIGFCFSERTIITLINNLTVVYTAVLARQNFLYFVRKNWLSHVDPDISERILPHEPFCWFVALAVVIFNKTPYSRYEYCENKFIMGLRFNFRALFRIFVFISTSMHYSDTLLISLHIYYEQFRLVPANVP
jgi:hypothetical protein